MIADQNVDDICFTFFILRLRLRPTAKGRSFESQAFGYGRRWKLHLRSNTVNHIKSKSAKNRNPGNRGMPVLGCKMTSSKPSVQWRQVNSPLSPYVVVLYGLGYKMMWRRRLSLFFVNPSNVLQKYVSASVVYHFSSCFPLHYHIF